MRADTWEAGRVITAPPSPKILPVNVGDATEIGEQISTRPLADGIMVLVWALLALAAGRLQFGYSSDYVEYLLYYESIPYTLSFMDTRFEPGFHLLAWVYRNWLGVSLGVLISSMAAFSLAVKFLLFRKYLSHPLLAVLIYVVLFYPIHEYTQYRAAVSLSMGYWAIHLLLTRRYAWAGLLFVLAFCFHYSSILLALVGIGGLVFRDRRIVPILLGVLLASATVLERFRFLLQDMLGALNPLSAAYLDNTTKIEGVSLLSFNNLLLIAALGCYFVAGYQSRSRYHGLFLTLTLASLLPIALLPEAPVIAQRSKEVLFLAVIFLACRSRLGWRDLPGFGFVVLLTALLGYLWVAGGIIFT